MKTEYYVRNVWVNKLSVAVALCWLFDTRDVVYVVISDTRDGWRADLSVAANSELFTGRGVGATPADAIRAAAIDVSAKITC